MTRATAVRRASVRLAAVAVLAAGEASAQAGAVARTSAHLTPAAAEVAAVEAAYATGDRGWPRQCEQLEAVRPSGDPRGQYVLADCLFRLGRVREATAGLRAAVASDPAALHAWAAVQMYLDLAEAPAPPRLFGAGVVDCAVLKPSSRRDAPAVTLPTVATAAPLFYPSVARFLKAKGRVVVDLCVGGDGRVTAAEVVESSGRLDFDALALVSVLESRFTPATVGGNPAPARVRMPVRFRLQ